MSEHNQLIKSASEGNMSAFEQLYNIFAPRLMGVCVRYALDKDEAKDLLQEAFIKVYEKLATYRFDGAFEGWIHRLTVNVALDNYRKRQKHAVITHTDTLLDNNNTISSEDILSQINTEELLKLVQNLPPAYRMVFNLYVIEGYKHHEIAEQLGISEGTSKSNLSDARRILQKKVKQLMYESSEQ